MLTLVLAIYITCLYSIDIPMYKIYFMDYLLLNVMNIGTNTLCVFIFAFLQYLNFSIK